MELFNLFDPDEKVIYLSLREILKEYFLDEKLRNKYPLALDYLKKEVFTDLKEDEINKLIDLFILTEINNRPELSKKYLDDKGNIKKESFIFLEEALKRKGRLPTKKVQVQRKTPSGKIIKYLTTVYVNKDKFKNKVKVKNKYGKKINRISYSQKDLKKGYEDSFNRFKKSFVYSKHKDLYEEKYEPVVQRYLKEGKYDKVQKYMKQFYNEIGIKTAKDFFPQSRIDEIIERVKEKLKDKIDNIINPAGI